MGLGEEDGVGVTLKAGKDVGAEVLRWGLESGRERVMWRGIFASDKARNAGMKRARLTLTGQMKYLYRISTLVIAKPKKMVKIQAPTKPSTVFLGDNLMSWVRPKVMPQM